MLLGIPRSARCVQRFDDSLKICNSHYISQFAAFFIDARAKRSVAESYKGFISVSDESKKGHSKNFYGVYEKRHRAFLAGHPTTGSQVCK